MENDVITQPAAPSPAAQEPALILDPGKMSPEQRVEWQTKGKYPEETPDSKPAPAATEPGSGDVSQLDGKPAETAPATEAGKTVEEKPQTAEQQAERERKAEIRKAKSQGRFIGHLQMRTKQLETELAELKAKAGTPQTDKSSKADAEPVLEDYDDFKDFRAAHREWAKAEARIEFEEEHRTKKTTETVKAIQSSWLDRADKYVKANAGLDFSVAEMNVSEMIRESSAFDVSDYLLESEKGPELTVYFDEHEAEFESLLKLSHNGRIKTLVKAEDALVAPAPPRKITGAPKPPSEVGGKSYDAKDPALSALERDDMGEYIRQQNKRELERRLAK